jgi:hypothetical protein
MALLILQPWNKLTPRQGIREAGITQVKKIFYFIRTNFFFC